MSSLDTDGTDDGLLTGDSSFIRPRIRAGFMWALPFLSRHAIDIR